MSVGTLTGNDSGISTIKKCRVNNSTLKGSTYSRLICGDCRLSIHGVEFGCKENFPLGDHVEAVIRPERCV